MAADPHVSSGTLACVPVYHHVCKLDFEYSLESQSIDMQASIAAPAAYDQSFPCIIMFTYMPLCQCGDTLTDLRNPTLRERWASRQGECCQHRANGTPYWYNYQGWGVGKANTMYQSHFIVFKNKTLKQLMTWKEFMPTPLHSACGADE